MHEDRKNFRFWGDHCYRLINAEAININHSCSTKRAVLSEQHVAYLVRLGLVDFSARKGTLKAR